MRCTPFLSQPQLLILLLLLLLLLALVLQHQLPPCCSYSLTVVTIAYERISTSFWCVMPMLRVPKNPRFLGPSLCWMANSSW